jgi:hypothetical protein
MQNQKYVAAQQQALESMRAANDDTAADGEAPDAKKQRGEHGSSYCVRQYLSLRRLAVAVLFFV